MITDRDNALAHYQQQGYTALPLFAPELVRAAQADISDHIDRLSRALYLPFEASQPNAPLSERIDRIWQHDRSHAALLKQAICTDAHRGPRLSALTESLTLREAAHYLCGRTIDGQVVRVRANIASFPDHRHPWHSDVARADGTDCSTVAITAWIPLDDAGPDAGGLELIPGMRDHPFPHREDQRFSIDESSLEGLPHHQPECPAGTVLFMDRFTPHRTLPAGNKARFALVIWMKGRSAD